MENEESIEEQRLQQLYQLQKEESEKKLAQYEKEMNEIMRHNLILLGIAILLTIMALIIPSRAHAYGEAYPYNPNWYVRSDKSEWANIDRKYFTLLP